MVVVGLYGLDFNEDGALGYLFRVKELVEPNLALIELYDPIVIVPTGTHLLVGLIDLITPLVRSERRVQLYDDHENWMMAWGEYDKQRNRVIVAEKPPVTLIPGEDTD